MQLHDADAWDDDEELEEGDEGEEGPLVFLCFAADDRAPAERLGGDLRRHGVAVAGHEYRVGPGENIVLAVERALTASDYFVLLWSRASRGDPWIDEQRTAAFVRDMREKRRFLFVLRLDDAPLPSVLTTRPVLDARDGWHAAVAELVATWRRERAFGDPVLPAPAPPDRAPARTLYVRNEALGVYHKLEHVPAGATGRDLEVMARAELRLPRRVTEFGDAVGLRFSYRFLLGDGEGDDGDGDGRGGGVPLPRDKPLASLGLEHGDHVVLEVTVEPFGPDGGPAGRTYLDDAEPGPAHLPPELVSALENEAFAHLRSWDDA